MKTITIAALNILMVIFCVQVGHCASVPPVAVKTQKFEQRLKEAKQHLIQQEYQRSFEAYQELLYVAPTDHEINYGLAWSAAAIGKFFHAILAYERLLAAEPENTFYRLQLARIYAYLGDRENMNDQLAQARQHDPTISKEMEQKFLNEFDHEAQQPQLQYGRFFRGSINAGLMYDSNANQGPNSNTLTLGAFDNLLFSGAKKIPSWANYANVRVEGGIRSIDHQNFWLVWDAGAYQRRNFNSAMYSNNGFVLGRAAAGVMYLNDQAMFDLRLKIEPGHLFHKTMLDQNLSSFGPEMSLMLNVAPQWILSTHAFHDNRHYTNPDSNSGQYWSAGQYVQRSFDDKKYLLETGVRFYGADQEDHDLGYKAQEFSLRGGMKFSDNVTLSPFMAFSQTNYRGPATALETENRHNRQKRLGVSILWNIDTDLALECAYQHVRDKSNSELYQYSQHLLNMGVVWKFR